MSSAPRRRIPAGLAAAAAAAAVLGVLAFAAEPAGAFVYWANNGDGGISRANNDGSGIDRDFIPTLVGTCGVAVNDSHIFWGNHDNAFGTSIGRAALDGSDVQQEFITGANGPCGVAVDDTYLYWENTADGRIGRALLDGSDVDQSFITPGGLPCGLAVTPTHIYWADEGSDRIGRANLDGSGVNTSYVTGASSPCGVAANSAHLYWANTGDVDPVISTTLGRANLDGSAVNQSFIGGAGSPCGVALSDTHIYWANFNPGVLPFTIGRANLNGSGTDNHFIITPGSSDFPCGVAVDDRRRASSAIVDCFPDAAALLQPTTCTATIADANTGPQSQPGGTVRFLSAAGGAAFTGGNECTLEPSSGPTSRCSVTYRPGFGSNLVLGFYRGDPVHEGSDDVGAVAVGRFGLGSLTRNPRRGTATLRVSVPGPGTVTLSSPAVNNVVRQVSNAGQLALPIVGTLATRRKLRRTRRAGVMLALRYAPTGGGAQESEVRALRLLKFRSGPGRKRR